MPEVRIINAATEVDPDFDQDVLRGTIDQETLRNIGIDYAYQRAQGFSPTEINELVDLLFQKKKVTDVTLGMRGKRFRKDGDSYTLLDPVFGIDGAQRLWAARLAMEKRPSLMLRMGAKVYFNTSQQSENDMFCAMNSTQQRVSASLLIRNKASTSPAAKVLVGLNSNDKFALRDCIGWSQKMQAGDSITGFHLTRTAGALHYHAFGKANGAAYDVLEALDKTCDKITPDILGKNIITFFDAIDLCWGIREGKRKPPCLKLLFLLVLAQLMSSFDEFWDGDEFFFSSRYQNKLKKVDVEMIGTHIRQMQRGNIDTKVVLSNILCEKLGLDKLKMRRTAPRPDERDGARI